MKPACLALSFLTLATGLVTAADSFDRYDANGDETVTFFELALGKKLDFEKLDRNRDRVVTAEEFNRPIQATDSPDPFDLFANPAFEQIDDDRNRTLTLAEFRKSVAFLINRCDTNADNAVSLAEYVAVVESEKKEAAAFELSTPLQ